MRQIADKISFFMAFCTAVFWITALTFKFFHFGFYDWDLSLYSHALWNFSQLHWFSSLYGANPFVDHGYYIALPLALFYKMFPSPLFLIFLKSFVFAAASFLIYKIARIKLPSWLAFGMQLAYIIFPANIYMMLFEFNFENLAVFLIPLILLALLTDRKRLYVVGILLLCLVKENMPLVVIMTGVWAIFQKKENRLFWAGFPILTGCIIFATGMFLLTPYLRSHLPGGGANLYLGLYQHVLNKPSNLLSTLFSNLNASYLKDLFGAQLPFSLLNAHAFLLAAPLLCQAMLSNTTTMHTIFFHYSASIVPIIFLATIFTLGSLKSRWSSRIFNLLMILFILGSLLHALVFLPDWNKRCKAWSDGEDTYRQAIVLIAPKNRPVIATFDFLNHLTDRPSVYALYNVWKGMNYFTGERPYTRALDADVAILDMMDPWLIADLNNDPYNTAARLRSYFAFKPWHLSWMHNNLVLLSANHDNIAIPMPISIQKTPFKDNRIATLTMAGVFLQGIDLDAFSVNPNRDVDLSMALYWGVNNAPSKMYFVHTVLKQDDKVFYTNTRLLGLALAPSPSWRSGEYVRENVIHSIPKLPPGDYIYSISILDGINGKILRWDDPYQAINVKIHVN